MDGQIVHAAIVDDVGHRLKLLGVQAARIVEVEAQLIGPDVRALLAGAFAQDVFERAMQQMGRRVVPPRPVAAR